MWYKNEELNMFKVAPPPLLVSVSLSARFGVCTAFSKTFSPFKLDFFFFYLSLSPSVYLYIYLSFSLIYIFSLFQGFATQLRINLVGQQNRAGKCPSAIQTFSPTWRSNNAPHNKWTQFSPPPYYFFFAARIENAAAFGAETRLSEIIILKDLHFPVGISSSLEMNKCSQER